MYTNSLTRMFKSLGCIAIVQVNLLGAILLLSYAFTGHLGDHPKTQRHQ